MAGNGRGTPVFLFATAFVILVVGGLYASPHLEKVTAEAPPGVPAVPASPAISPSPVALHDVAPVMAPTPVSGDDRLTIASIGVDAPIKDVGLTKDGNMDVPSDISEVGWYDLGARPGNAGSAVLAGHLDGKKGEPGVFAKLRSVKVGDKVVVAKADGSLLTFVVRQTRTYDQDARPQEVFVSASGAHLNLITCTGSWDTGIGQFSKRLVVFTDLASASIAG